MDAIQRLIMIAERERCKRQYQEPSHRTTLRPAAPTASRPQLAGPADHARTQRGCPKNQIRRGDLDPPQDPYDSGQNGATL